MSVIYNALKKVQEKQNNLKNQNFARKRNLYKGFLEGFSLPQLRDIYVFPLVSLVLLIGYLFINASWQLFNPATFLMTNSSIRSDFINEIDNPKRHIEVEGLVKIENSDKIEENSHLIHNRKGIKFFNEAQYSRALSEFEKAISFDADYAEPYNNIGIVFKKKGDMEKALEYYERALLLNPEYTEALNNSGVVLLSMGRTKKAESRFKKTIELRPSYADPYLNLAQSLDSSGSEYQALRYYESFLTKYTGDDVQLIANLKKRALQIRSSSIYLPNS